jgi:hypothetical protein
MLYRVHYMTENERRTAQVDASSPQEAVVKFQHVRCDSEDPRNHSARVLSVLPEPESEHLPW